MKYKKHNQEAVMDRKGPETGTARKYGDMGGFGAGDTLGLVFGMGFGDGHGSIMGEGFGHRPGGNLEFASEMRLDDFDYL